MNKHTPGPWFVMGCDVKPLGDRPFICWTGTPERKLEEARANARLIAAAPEMLEVCEHALSVLNAKEIDALQAFTMVERLKAVINKARGE